MGRKKNLQTREIIQQKAFELFRNNGYHKTAISDIAIACNVDKTLIQYYFPKKELIVQDYLRRLLELSVKACHIDMVGEKIDLGGFYRMGILYFDYLLAHNKLSHDIFADRKLTNHIIDMNIGYARAYLAEMKIDPEKAEEEIVMAMGGAYELLYRYLTKGIDSSGNKIIGKVITSFVLGMGGTIAEAQEILNQHQMTERQRKAGIRYIEQHLLAQPAQ